MSEGKSAPKTNNPPNSPCFICAEEAAALLNCVAEKKYNEMRCYPLIKKLRACVEKKVNSYNRAAIHWTTFVRILLHCSGISSGRLPPRSCILHERAGYLLGICLS